MSFNLSLAPLRGLLEVKLSETAPANNLALVVYTARALKSAEGGKDKKLREIRLARLRRMMAFCLGEIGVWEVTGEAVVFPFGFDKRKGRSKHGIAQMVGVHLSRFPFRDAMNSGAEQVTVSLRALTKDDSPWRDAITAANFGANRPMQGFLNELLEFYGAEPGVYYRGVITGVAGNVLRRNRSDANALARAAKVFTIDELQRARVAAMMHRREEDVDKRMPAEFLFLHGVDEEEDHYRVGDYGKNCHAIWNIVVGDGWQLKALLELPVDMVFQVENVGGDNYARVQVTAAATSPGELNRTEATLRMLCKEVDRLHVWEPVGASMLEALMASLPGSPQLLRAPEFSIPDAEYTAIVDGLPKGFFDQIGDVPNEATEGRSGNVAYGRAISANRYDQHTLTISTDTHKVAAVIGETMSGKSVLAWIMGMQAAGRNLVFVHHSTTEDEFAGRLARSLGGTYLNPELPIVNDEVEFRTAATQIREETAQKFKRWEEEWKIAGYPLHLPLVIRVASGTEALAVFYKRFVRQEILRLLAKFHADKEYRWKFALVDDDLADLPGDAVVDFDLGSIPANEGTAMRHDISASVNKIRKIGCELYLLTIQSHLQFEQYGPGMFRAIPLAFLLSPGNHDVGAIARPKDMPDILGFSFEEAAQAIVEGKTTQLPPWLIKPYLFSPWLPESLRQQMGIK